MINSHLYTNWQVFFLTNWDKPGPSSYQYTQLGKTWGVYWRVLYVIKKQSENFQDNNKNSEPSTRLKKARLYCSSYKYTSLQNITLPNHLIKIKLAFKKVRIILSNCNRSWVIGVLLRSLNLEFCNEEIECALRHFREWVRFPKVKWIHH